MQNKSKRIGILVIFISFFMSVNVYANYNSFKVLDEKNDSSIPSRYRKIDELNISGSGQFNPNQLWNLVGVINAEKLLDIDLRQESHGFINNIPFSYAGDENILNNGLGSNMVFERELNELDKITINSSTDIYNKNRILVKTLLVNEVLSECELVRENGIEYIRLAVKDNEIPSLEVVDYFINIAKNKPKNIHIHFHCDYGEVRTTMFMVMYQIMNNNSKLSLNEILEYQSNNGGVLLTNSNIIRFLNDFYNYVNDNKSNNYDTIYSNWTTFR